MQRLRTVDTNSGKSLKPFVQKRCIFVHIPKTAGVSVCRALFGNLGGGHSTIKNYQFAFNETEFDSYFKFTFVRNPWDRLYSAYNFLKSGGLNRIDSDWAAANLSAYRSFNEFVLSWVNAKSVYKYHHFIPQYRFLCTPECEKPQVNFVGLFENLAHDFTHVRNQLSMCSNVTLGHENKTATISMKNEFSNSYSAEAREIVSEVYKKDIEIFGYSFDNSTLGLQLSKRTT